MSITPTAIFVCEHGAAKSIIAAAYFNKLAQERKIRVHAIARGTHPDEELTPAALEGLIKDGLKPGEQKPRHLSEQEITNAVSLVTFCSLPADLLGLSIVEDWKDIPPVSDGYDISRDAILVRMQSLLEKLRADHELA